MAPSFFVRPFCRPFKNAFCIRYHGFYNEVKNYSVQEIGNSEADKNKALKYIGSKASKLKISENINLTSKDKISFSNQLIFCTSIAIFLIYFCVLREENDIDEMLKGNEKYKNNYTQLSDLYFKLQYCKANKLPTTNLENKIKELKQKLGIDYYDD